MSTKLHTQAIPASFFNQRDGTWLTWLGMAGALINARGTLLLIDPLLTTVTSEGQDFCESGYRLKIPLPIEAAGIPKADVVMYTHADDDHLGINTAITLAERLPCRFIAPAPVARILQEAGIAHERITIAEDFHTMQIGRAEVTITPALHNWQPVNPWQRGDCCGYLVKTPDGVIWHPGDTRLIDELYAYKDVDVMFFDVAAVDSHLGPQGSARLAVSCGARTMIAYHYGTFVLPPGSFGSFDPEEALPFVKDIPARFLCPSPGDVLQVSK
ncbi:MAG TPA: MBL fold metallo-hydrolase [Anaerolineae bacterium]|jgi:L-ascorbate metabolism protein UlaG (beta-lactamase superfamily)